jgi:hypothetical protein
MNNKKAYNILLLEVPCNDTDTLNNNEPCSKDIIFYADGTGLSQTTIEAMRDFIRDMCEHKEKKNVIYALFGKACEWHVQLMPGANVACMLRALADGSALPAACPEPDYSDALCLYHEIRLFNKDVRLYGDAKAFMTPNDRSLTKRQGCTLPRLEYGATLNSFFTFHADDFVKAIDLMVADARSYSMLDRYLLNVKAARGLNDNYVFFC